MSALSNFWSSIVGAFQSALELIHELLEPLVGEASWGWSIIAMTLIIRVLLLPIAVKQSRSMRAMQEIQPKIKAIQDRHKVDRKLASKDPELYKKKKEAQNKEMMELYQEEGVNPAASCLPLVAQAPIFFALFSVLRNPEFEALRDAPFYFVTDHIQGAIQGLGAITSDAGWPGWLLIAGMVVTMFVTQKQTMARSSTGDAGPAAQQQKVLLYVMPAFLGFISRGLPLGVLLYWVTTNLWQGVQQYIIFRDRERTPQPTSRGTGSGTKGGRGAEDARSAKDATGSDEPKGSGGSRATPPVTGSDDGSPASTNGSPSKETNGSRSKETNGSRSKDGSKGARPDRSRRSGGSGTSHLPARRS